MKFRFFWFKFITDKNYENEPDFENISKEKNIIRIREYNEKIFTLHKRKRYY